MLGLVLSVLTASGQGPAVWVLLAIRLVLFATVIGVAARWYGPGAGLVALVTAIVTRGLVAGRARRT